MQRPDIRPIMWRVTLLIIAIAALAYSSVRKVEFDPKAATLNQTWLALDAADLKKPSFGERDYKSIAEHPLFEPSRQPWSPAKPVFQKTSVPNTIAPSLMRYVLVGLVLSAGQNAALLRDNFGKTRIVREGSKIDGWSVRRIDAIGVHFYFGDSTFHITMHKQAY